MKKRIKNLIIPASLGTNKVHITERVTKDNAGIVISECSEKSLCGRKVNGVAYATFHFVKPHLKCEKCRAIANKKKFVYSMYKQFNGKF